jgi:hypothetical protein
MRWNWKYAIITLLILIIEILIALFLHDKFIRPFLGDALVVVLLYFGFRTILKTPAHKVAIGVFAFACTIEILQFFQLVKLLHLEENEVARIIIGSTFDWWDILAYAIGILAVYVLDKRFLDWKN